MPLTSLTFQCTHDPAEAKTWYAGLISDEPVLMSVIASVADSVLDDSARIREPALVVRPRCIWTRRRGVHVHLAIPHCTWPWPRRTGRWRSPSSLPGRAIPYPASAAAADPPRPSAMPKFDITGASARTVMAVGAFDLPARPTVPFDVTGHYRNARPDELPLVDRWAAGLQRCRGTHSRKADSLVHRVAAGRVGFWGRRGDAPRLDGSRLAGQRRGHPDQRGVDPVELRVAVMRLESSPHSAERWTQASRACSTPTWRTRRATRSTRRWATGCRRQHHDRVLDTVATR